ncbi:hypothetical protein BB559_002000 [Furculomyces boomerangus]|uniref:Ribosomal protein L5 C-terminal domain-containing protein n=2 Tax=Harpellales TaxID=61421 RepID=A0A2T9YZ22_9FUNG|nr:hypothetical protein BB559_002000 [Furculomyces boomerangus]PVZ96930.1 hypothetical protein BB558_007130 [Smittium angustum]
MTPLFSNINRLANIKQFGLGCIKQQRSYSRLADFYNNTLRDDLTILQYNYNSEKINSTKATESKDSVNQTETKKKLSETEILLGKNPRKVPAIKQMDGQNSPKIESITVHIRMKEALVNKHNVLSGLMALQCITGQNPSVVKARTDAAAWKLRKGMPIAAKVVLRGEDMYEFMDKLTETVLPRLKEWDGLKVNSGDGLGNFSLGFSPAALGLFSEIETVYDMFPIIYGFMINIKTTASRNNDGRLLLSGFKLPFIQPRPRAAPKKGRRKN